MPIPKVKKGKWEKERERTKSGRWRKKRKDAGKKRKKKKYSFDERFMDLSLK
ncbi:MAG: hypothetical protein QXK26_04280 [Candidatus Bathyarchaeia archaeon]